MVVKEGCEPDEEDIRAKIAAGKPFTAAGRRSLPGGSQPQ